MLSDVTGFTNETSDLGMGLEPLVIMGNILKAYCWSIINEQLVKYLDFVHRKVET